MPMETPENQSEARSRNLFLKKRFCKAPLRTFLFHHILKTKNSDDVIKINDDIAHLNFILTKHRPPLKIEFLNKFQNKN